MLRLWTQLLLFGRLVVADAVVVFLLFFSDVPSCFIFYVFQDLMSRSNDKFARAVKTIKRFLMKVSLHTIYKYIVRSRSHISTVRVCVCTISIHPQAHLHATLHVAINAVWSLFFQLLSLSRFFSLTVQKRARNDFLHKKRAVVGIGGGGGGAKMNEIQITLKLHPPPANKQCNESTRIKQTKVNTPINGKNNNK